MVSNRPKTEVQRLGLNVWKAEVVISLSVRSFADPRTAMERRATMTLAKRLTQVFNIDVETCRTCDGAAKVIACTEDPVVIEKIPTHLDEKALPIEAPPPPESQALPQVRLHDLYFWTPLLMGGITECEGNYNGFSL